MENKEAIEYLLYMKHNVIARSPMDIAIDTAIESLKAQTVNRWISCNEKFPEEGQDVIIYIVKRWKENPIQIAHIQHDDILWELSDGEHYFPKDEVTHWMPLPEPPERE